MHVHHADRVDRRLAWSILLNAAIVVAEFVGGIASGSLALLSDAVHNLTDVLSLVLAMIARRFARRPPSARHTFGFRRLEVLAALGNSAMLLVAVTLLVRESIVRLLSPREIDVHLMLPIAIVGLAANLAAVLLLHRHAKDDDLNVRSAFAHLVQDTLTSVIVVGVGIAARWGVPPWVDPAASLVVSLFIVRVGWRIFTEAFAILMEAAPAELDVEQLADECTAACDIEGLHHVHVWQTGGGERLLTAHVKLCNRSLDDVERILREVHRHLAVQWGIEHATLEPECRGCGSEEVIERHGHRLTDTKTSSAAGGAASAPAAGPPSERGAPCAESSGEKNRTRTADPA